MKYESILVKMPAVNCKANPFKCLYTELSSKEVSSLRAKALSGKHKVTQTVLPTLFKGRADAPRSTQFSVAAAHLISIFKE